MKKILYILLLVPLVGFCQCEEPEIEYLSCEEPIFIYDEFYGQNSEWTDEEYYFNTYSFNISSQTTFEILIAAYLYECIESCYFEGIFLIYKDGQLLESFEFNEWENNLPSYINLNPGNYTFLYGHSSENGISNDLSTMLFYNSDSFSETFGVEIQINMYNEICEKEGCTSPSAINFDPVASQSNNTCVTLNDFGDINCDTPIIINDILNVGTACDINNYVGGTIQNSHPFSAFSFNTQNNSGNIGMALETQSFIENCDYQNTTLHMYVFQNNNIQNIYNINDYELIDIYPSTTYNIIISPFNMYEDGINLFYLSDVIHWLNGKYNDPWWRSTFLEYNLSIILYNGECYKEGCIDTLAINFDALATTDNGSCSFLTEMEQLTCGDNTSSTFQIDSNIQHSGISFIIEDTLNINYSFLNVSGLPERLWLYKDGIYENSLSHNITSYYGNDYLTDGFWDSQLTPGEYTIIFGETLSSYGWGSINNTEFSIFNVSEYDPDRNYEFDFYFTLYNDNCEYEILGCTDVYASNYNEYATLNNNLCTSFDFQSLETLECGVPTELLIKNSSSSSYALDKSDFLTFEVIDTIDIYFTGEHSDIHLFVFDSINSLSNSILLSSFSEMSTFIPGEYTIGVTRLNLSNDEIQSISSLNSYFDILINNNSYLNTSYSLNIFPNDGSCPVFGCTDFNAINYISYANADDSTCVYPIDLGMLNCGQTVQRSTTSSSFEDYLYSFEIENTTDVTFSCKSNYPPAITIYNEYFEIVEILYPEEMGSGSEFINKSTEINQGKYYIYINKSWSYDGVEYHNIYDQTSIWLDFHNISILVYDGVCDLHGCIDSLALNYNPIATLDDGSCIPYTSLGALSCGNNYEFDSDTISDMGNILSTSGCSGLFSDLHQYSSINFTLDNPSIVNISSTGETFDCDNNLSSGTSITSCLLLNDIVIHKYSWQFNINETTWGHNVFPLELGSGDYKFISYKTGAWSYMYPAVGLTNLELLNRIGISSTLNGFKYLISSNVVSYNGTCDYEGCMDSNAYNYSEYHTTNFIDDCGYTYNINCGVNQSIELISNNEFGFIQSDFFPNEGIISFELENPTEVEINVSGGNPTIYKDNIFNIVAPFYLNGNHYNLDAGIYLVGVESVNNEAEVELNCLGCTDSDAFNYNSQAITENSTCCYPQVFYDCNGVCLNDFDVDLICDEHEIYGCTYPWSDNYDSIATNDDGSCIDLTNLIFNQTDSINSLVIDLNAIQQQLNSANSEIVNLNSTIELTSSNIIDLENQLEILLFNQEDGINQSNVDSIQALLDSANTTIYLLNNTLAVNSAIISELEDQLSIVIENPISIQLLDGWNMIGFSCIEGKDISNALSTIADVVLILKDNNGSVYLPEFGFNGIGDLTPGYGYQLKVSDYVLDFNICEE